MENCCSYYAEVKVPHDRVPELLGALEAAGYRTGGRDAHVSEGADGTDTLSIGFDGLDDRCGNVLDADCDPAPSLRAFLEACAPFALSGKGEAHDRDPDEYACDSTWYTVGDGGVRARWSEEVQVTEGQTAVAVWSGALEELRGLLARRADAIEHRTENLADLDGLVAEAAARLLDAPAATAGQR